MSKATSGRQTRVDKAFAAWRATRRLSPIVTGLEIVRRAFEAGFAAGTHEPASREPRP